jgi:hypothetical protein
MSGIDLTRASTCRRQACPARFAGNWFDGAELDLKNQTRTRRKSSAHLAPAFKTMSAQCLATYRALSRNAALCGARMRECEKQTHREESRSNHRPGRGLGAATPARTLIRRVDSSHWIAYSLSFHKT